MLEHPTVTELDEAAGAAADELLLVRGADIHRWARELARLRAAVSAERRACRIIVEDQLRLMLVERRSDPVALAKGMLARMDAREREFGGS
jgi:hypothetical protein